MARIVKFDTANRTVTFPVKSITSIEMTPITIPAGYWGDCEDGLEEEWVAEEGEMLVANVTVNIVGLEPLKFKVLPEFAAAFGGWVTKQHTITDFGDAMRKAKVFPLNECDFI